MKTGIRGITLTELIVAVAILAIIMIPISSILMSGYLNYYSEDDTMVAQSNARAAMDSIINDLRQYEFNISTYHDGYDDSGKSVKKLSSLSYQDSTGVHLVISDVSKGMGVNYSWSDGKLTRIPLSLSNATVWDNITSFTVSEDPSSETTNVVRIIIEAQVLPHGRKITLDNEYRRKAPVVQN